MIKKIITTVLAACVVISTATAMSASASASEFTKNSYDFTKQMTVGINIGNTLDSAFNGSETYWGCPKITEGLIDAYKSKGFDTIRVPITWCGVTDLNGNWKDNSVFINRVKEVVDWIYNRGLYCIIDTHHEMNWLNTWDAIKNSDESAIDQTKLNAMLNRLRTLWTNVSNEFKNYGERLVFEAYNETRASSGTWSSIAEDRDVLQQIGQTMIDSVRATGSNNLKRYIILNTYAAGCDTREINNMKVPTDPANHIIIGVHSYAPVSMNWEGSKTTFVQSELDNALDAPFEALKTRFLEKGIGVILGEMGQVAKDNDPERVKYAQAITKKCYKYGVIPIWWENFLISSGEKFGLINRNSPYNWYAESVVDAFVNSAKQYGATRPNYDASVATTTTTTTTTTVTTTTTTTKATTTTTTKKVHEKGDINGDGKVNIIDLLIMKKCISVDGYESNYPESDLNNDGKINVLDLIIIKKLLGMAN